MSTVTPFIKCAALLVGLSAVGTVTAGAAPAAAAPLPSGVGVPWATTVTGGGADWATAIATGTGGASVVAGNFGSPTAAFGTTTLTRAGASGTDAFVTNVTERGAFASLVGGKPAKAAIGAGDTLVLRYDT